MTRKQKQNWRKESVAQIQHANNFIKCLKQAPVDPHHIVCHNFAFTGFNIPVKCAHIQLS